MNIKTTSHTALVATLLAATMTVFGAPATAKSAPKIYEAVAFDAPIDAKGGVMNPVPYCSNYRTEPRVRWVLANAETGYSRTFRWRGSLPGLYFPRVEAGTYRSTVVAWCGKAKARDVHSVEVGQKTHQTTVSKAEFRRVKVGMTPQRVRQIVGYGGVATPVYAGERTRTYDMMAFWRWSVVVYRHGKVVRKYWDVDHD
ncbi:hypothetical protein AB0N29_19710 [Nocardioides sp. NPDC092400]|uniref:hypothetical protein n=1 Tax=Nocardioides sp. NPDC092400 TaxID=3155196 RepID=UPI00342B136D